MPGVQVGVGYIDIRPDLKGFGRELQNGVTRNAKSAGDDASRTLKASFATAAKGAAAAFGTAFAAVRIKDFFGGAIKAASDLSESTTKAGEVFGAATIKVKSFAEGAADAIGQSNQQALEAAGTFGNLFTAMGLGQTQAADMSISLVKLASDLASFNNVSPDDALLALRAGLVGEQEPLRRFGVNLNEATLKQKALDLGLRVGKGTLDAGVKAQAAYALILEQTTTAQGDFARTADGLANQQRTMTAQWTDAKAELGEGLLPVMIDLAHVLNDEIIPAFKSFFSATEGDATGWAVTLRNVITDTLGFIVGTLQQTLRLMANVFDKLPTRFGEGIADDLREAADSADVMRVQLHASKEELVEWAGATRNADAAAKLLATSTKKVGAAMKDSLGPTEEETKAIEAAAAARRDLEGANRSLADAERGLTKAQKERDLAAAAFAILGTDTAADELAEKEENLADAKDSVADAGDRVLDAQEKVNDKEAEMVAKTPSFVGSVNARTDAVKALNDQLGITKDHLGILNDSGNILSGLTGKVLPAPVAPVAPPPPLFANFGPGVNPSTNLGIGVPSINIPKVNNVTVNVTQPLPDPGLVGKQIAWALD
jgi:hypothetical protein